MKLFKYLFKVKIFLVIATLATTTTEANKATLEES